MEILKREIEIQNQKYIYYIHIKKIKNMILRVDEKGRIVVSANAYIPFSKIDEFVQAKIEWIFSKKEKIANLQDHYYHDVFAQDVFYLFGKPLSIVRILSNRNYCVHDEQCLYVYYKCEEDAHKSVLKWIRKICEKEFKEVVDIYYDKLKEYRFVYPSVKYRAMTSRWGSCIPSKNQITLNTKMIHFPKAFLEYVVLHELVHFIQPNHSDSFYRIIQYHMPDYKIRKAIPNKI